MIKEKVKLVKRMDKFVTRICDECGVEDQSRMGVILRGRKLRGGEIDLCFKCSNLRKYKPEKSWPKKEKSHMWKGGRRKGANGIRLYAPSGGYIYEHRKVVEGYLNRKLLSSEIVHHIDMDNHNNDIKNLYLCKNLQSHGVLHYNLELLGYELLNHKIWFNYEEKKYVLYSTEIPQEKKQYIPLNIDYKVHTAKRKNSKGSISYSQIYNKPIGNGKYQKKYVHIEIMKNAYGRNMYRNEVVHHIDGNGLNNVFSNLILMTNQEHIACHRALQNRVAELYKKRVIGFKEGIYHVC